MRRTLFVFCSLAIVVAAVGSARPANAISRDQVLLSFSNMVGVTGVFRGDDKPIRGIPGDGLPWVIRDADGVLLRDGSLNISVRGLVFPNIPEVPVNLRGINDEDEFRAIVSCLAADSGEPVNVSTKGFRANRSGDAQISARLKLPKPCVAPIIFIVAADEDDWLAVTGGSSSY